MSIIFTRSSREDDRDVDQLCGWRRWWCIQFFYTQQSPWIHQHHQTNITTKYRLHHFREGIFGGILLQDTLFKTEEYHTLHHHQSSFKKIITNEGLSSLPPILSFSLLTTSVCFVFSEDAKLKLEQRNRQQAKHSSNNSGE